jgi:hypothetical protein
MVFLPLQELVPADLNLYDSVTANPTAILSLLNAHHKAATTVALSPTAPAPNASLLASAGLDGAVVLWAVSVTAVPPQQLPEGEPDPGPIYQLQAIMADGATSHYNIRYFAGCCFVLRFDSLWVYHSVIFRPRWSFVDGDWGTTG